MRPERLVAVLGTDTEVGKTWVSAATLSCLRHEAGVRVAARKPVQSFAPCDVETDAHVLALATGEAPEEVTPRHRWYAMAMAPPMAAAFLGLPVPGLDELVAELAWPDGIDVGVVETVGGPRSPIADEADSVDLAAAIEPDLCVLVAHAGLGAINATRLSAPACPQPLVVFLNHFDGGDLHDRNRRWLEADGFDVVVDVAALARRLRP